MKARVSVLPVAWRFAPARVLDFWTLSKPELSLLSLLTTLAGFVVAVHGSVDFPLLAATLAGTGLLAAGAAALNMYLEREFDARMRRTQRRPIPAGRVTPAEARAFGLTAAAAGALILGVCVNPLTMGLGVLTCTSYLLLYTPLKRYTTWNTLVGCVPGAIPPMMGWTAVRNDLPAQAWALFLILFVWQMPHFLALAWMYRQDYKRGGFRMLPGEEERGVRTSAHILAFTTVLLPVSLLPFILHMSGAWYAGTAVTLGAAFLALGIALAVRRTNDMARRVFFMSLVYIPALFAILMLDKR